ncbi:hypothetical protein [Euzebya sp.]|uniref:hypothetical protein n=1 Tax=Euzebya sp. TaxID=1971409 RepID=UPI00351274EE
MTTSAADRAAAGPAADYTPVSTQSLRELRVQLLQRAATTAARARSARSRGDIHQAQALEARAAKLYDVARSVNVS